ncbi:MAG: hypothetical protein QNJ90_10200 [Planctomycetota bacterium]|nr:hypothetical protein [Planctomycetota bacterium]
MPTLASTCRTLSVFLLLAAGAVLVTDAAAEPRGGAKSDPKKAGGSTYRNAKLGVRARGPAGWKMVADRKGVAPTRWQRLVTFNDGATDAQATLSFRPRSATTLDDLLAMVRKDWDKSADRLRVSSMRKIEASALNRIGQVVVDGSFTRKAKPAKAKKGVPAPPSAGTPMRVQAIYYLGPGHTYLLYAQAQQTHWSRLRSRLERLRQSVQFDKAVEKGPTGEGSYRNDATGFACRFPKNYTVVTPQRENHLVQFEGVGAEDAVLSVYGFKWEQSAEKDAERLVAHYEEDKGGTASARTMEVAGQEGFLVTAKAMLGGVDRVVMIAVVKRGSDCFRLRASMPATAEAKGTAVFRAFVAGFKFSRAR